MKLIPVTYQGFTAMDRRFSSPMLPWIVCEIRKRNYNEKLSLGVEDGILQSYNQDFELQFSHKISQLMRFSQADLDPCTFLYLLRDDFDTLLYCYLYQAKKPHDVTELYRQMKDQNHHQPTPTRSLSNASNLTSLCVDISPSSSNFFEVLYIGKIRLAEKKVPETFVDEALEKFKTHELEKHRTRQIGNIGKLKSENDIVARSKILYQMDTSKDNITSSTSTNFMTNPQQATFQRSKSFHSSLIRTVSEDKEDEIPEEDKMSEKNISTDAVKSENNESIKGSEEDISNSTTRTTETNNEMKTPVEIDDHNRTMVLQVDRTDLRLISPDRKVILLHKHHRDVTACLQGRSSPEHFGFICHEGNNAHPFVAFIFKCESSSVASDACAAITQAFLNSESRPRAAVTSCEHCPMVWFHKLCVEIENMSDRKTQAAIFRRLEQLDEDEQELIKAKFHGADTNSVREQNEFLMMLLRAHCEMKQGRHIHDTAENRSEFLNQYLGGGTIFTKAKRSFDQLLKRKSSRDDFASSLKGMSLPIHNNLNREASPGVQDFSDRDSEGTRSRSSTIGSQSDLKESHLTVNDTYRKGSVSPEKSMASDKGPKSPMMDIFLKVGNSPKSANSSDDDGGSPQNLDAGSWRQAIFKRVITPRKITEDPDTPRRKRTKEELKILWKKSIYQAILLVRMEKENARIRAEQEESAVKRIKLEYDEMKPNQREVMEVWEMLTNKENDRYKYDKQMLLHAIRQGVPRGKRGEVWQILAEQFCAKVPPIDADKFPNYNIPYETLLKQLTSHQHAILIDLGRTFPNHSYFSSPLGPGQLALFNLLKAYSLLDPEVGYCQGLSFVAGVLLLHMEEAQAFFLLRHLMFRRGMRTQYLPDMVSLQIKLYQLSRLLHDQLPDLYNHFDFYEVAPTLYAAPWLLTVFASQFPLGFVTRVFDLIFLEGPDVIFRVALALLTHHKDKLMQCDGFEEIMTYLKVQLANIDKPTLDKVMKQVFSSDVSRQLNEYKVEYQVLQEEMCSVQPQVEALRKLEAQNKTLTEQNKNLMTQLEIMLGNVQRLEKIRVLQQSQVNKLEMHTRAQDVTINTLGNFIEGLIERKLDIEIPDDVRRILTQIQMTERRRSDVRPQQNNLLKMLQKSMPDNTNTDNKQMVKSLSTGRINLSQNLQDQNMYRTNSLKTQTPIDIPKNKLQQSSNNNSTEKISKFFSSSHNNILQQRLNAQNNYLNTTIDIKIQEFGDAQAKKKNSSETKEDGCGKMAEKQIAFDEHDKVSPTNSVDSGVVTPNSPKDVVALENHPLSNCDVNFSYKGSRELKSIPSNSSLYNNKSSLAKNGTAAK